jgi:hypothetical protein
MTISVSELNMSKDNTNSNGNANATPSSPKKQPMHTHNERPRRSTKTVVILGAAYGGARAARLLAGTLPAGWRLVVIDRNSHMNREFPFHSRGGADEQMSMCFHDFRSYPPMLLKLLSHIRKCSNRPIYPSRAIPHRHPNSQPHLYHQLHRPHHSLLKRMNYHYVNSSRALSPTSLPIPSRSSARPRPRIH